MTKKIVTIGTDTISSIIVGEKYLYGFSDKPHSIKDLVVKSIDLVESSEGTPKESYIVKFQESTKTLEVFDVNYVIRDEE